MGNDANVQQDTSETNGHENGQVIAVLKEQLELANAQEQQFVEREQEYASREQQLMDLLKTEQKKSEILMLPKPKPRGSFLNYFRFRR